MEVWRWKGGLGNGNYYHYYYYEASEEILRQLKVGSVQIEIAGLPLNAFKWCALESEWKPTRYLEKKTYTVLLVFLCWLDKEYLLHLGGKINSPLDSQSQFA